MLEGEPRILIRDGVILTRAVQQEGIATGDLMSAIRQHGVADVDGVELAVLETNGSISVIPSAAPRPPDGPEGDRRLNADGSRVSGPARSRHRHRGPASWASIWSPSSTVRR